MAKIHIDTVSRCQLRMVCRSKLQPIFTANEQTLRDHLYKLRELISLVSGDECPLCWTPREFFGDQCLCLESRQVGVRDYIILLQSDRGKWLLQWFSETPRLIPNDFMDLVLAKDFECCDC